jgi:hypothetical protein
MTNLHMRFAATRAIVSSRQNTFRGLRLPRGDCPKLSPAEEILKRLARRNQDFGEARPSVMLR